MKKQKHDSGSGPDVANTESGGTKKHKPKKGKKKEPPKSRKTISESESSDGGEAMCSKLCSQPTEEEISKCQSWRTDKWSLDLPSVNSYCRHKGIILENPLAFSLKYHSNYIRQMLQTNELGLFIMPLSELLVQYKKDTSDTREKYYVALKTLASASMGKSSALPLFVVECFKTPMMKEVITHDNVNGYYSQVMTGLYGLFTFGAISKITMSDTGNDKKMVSECFCPLCVYVVGNHMSMNNHICYHLWLALLCHIRHCFNIKTQAEGMWKHILNRHQMTPGDSTTGKK